MAYSRSGGTLKHSTGLMKVKHMHYVMDWREDLRIEQEREAKRLAVAARSELITHLMQGCYDIEGDAFTTWWDDDNNVPAQISQRDQINILEQRLRNHAQAIIDSQGA